MIEIEIDPHHEVLMERAGGDPDCDHDWTSEGEGGCGENPGVWSVGGTTLVIRAHCRRCGLRRVETLIGAQRNPGEHNTVQYFRRERGGLTMRTRNSLPRRAGGGISRGEPQDDA